MAGLKNKTSQFSSISTTKVGTNNLQSNVSPNMAKSGTHNLQSPVSPIKMTSGTNNLQSNFSGGAASGGNQLQNWNSNTPLSQADVTPGEGLSQ